MGLGLKMLLSTLVFGLLYVGAFAQEKTTTSTAPAATFTVDVGRGDHVFTPDVTQANVGDIVQFNFAPLNHSVVRAEYLYPCIPYEKMAIGETGFFSGFHPVDAVLPNPPSWSIRINDTAPIFFYCSAPGSCLTYGMVGVINPNSTQLLSTQKARARNSTFMLQPGEAFPAEASSALFPFSSSTAAATTSMPSSTSSAVAAATATAEAESTSQKSSFPASAIAGIVVGVVIIVALAAALFYFVGRHRTMKNQEAVASMHGAEKLGTGGSMSPAAPPPGAPVMGPGGMVYVPVSAADLHRISIPPLYGNSNPSQNHVSTGTHPGMTSLSTLTSSPAAEMYAPKEGTQHG